ncbi:MAG: VOC family protein [Pseudomonadota bacterium]
MLAYAMVGTNDKQKAIAFYDALFEVIGAKQLFSTDRSVFWGFDMGQPMFGVGDPFDGEDACLGNGCMTCIGAPSKEVVDKFYAKALELGGTDEGEPGPRADGAIYTGYFRDLDGNKLNIAAFPPF